MQFQLHEMARSVMNVSIQHLVVSVNVMDRETAICGDKESFSSQLDWCSVR
jgi:hypothetical protein